MQTPKKRNRQTGVIPRRTMFEPLRPFVTSWSHTPWRPEDKQTDITLMLPPGFPIHLDGKVIDAFFWDARVNHYSDGRLSVSGTVRDPDLAAWAYEALSTCTITFTYPGSPSCDCCGEGDILALPE